MIRLLLCRGRLIHIAPRADFEAAANPAQRFRRIGSALRAADLALAQAYRPVGEQNLFGVFQNFLGNDDGRLWNEFAFHLF